MAKTARTEKESGKRPPHIVTTGYMTELPIRDYVNANYAEQNVWVSRGLSVGLRMVPTVRDLQFAWEEMPQQVLDEQQEKMRTSLRSALTNWARTAGEAADYADNLPFQCIDALFK